MSVTPYNPGQISGQTLPLESPTCATVQPGGSVDHLPYVSINHRDFLQFDPITLPAESNAQRLYFLPLHRYGMDMNGPRHKEHFRFGGIPPPSLRDRGMVHRLRLRKGIDAFSERGEEIIELMEDHTEGDDRLLTLCHKRVRRSECRRAPTQVRCWLLERIGLAREQPFRQNDRDINDPLLRGSL